MSDRPATIRLVQIESFDEGIVFVIELFQLGGLHALWDSSPARCSSPSISGKLFRT